MTPRFNQCFHQRRYCCRFFLALLLLAATATPSSAWIFQPLRQIQKDYQALTRRVTARHILLPPKSDELCISLRQKIRSSDSYIVDSFEAAAKRYSRDDTTNFRGGLLGELVPQGYCRSPELDRACFQVRLGVIEGPIVTEYGSHLLLVTERTNCAKLDGVNTRLQRSDAVDGGTQGILVPSPQVGQVDAGFVIQQIAFWIGALVAGGLLAEVLARIF